MTFFKPMLASPMPANFRPAPGTWCAENKYDGHRIIVAVAPTGGDLFGNPSIRAWSRDGIPRVLPPHVRIALESLSSGVYDGELHVPGKRSFGVTELTESKNLVYTVFDVVELLGRDTKEFFYTSRRAYLEEIFNHKLHELGPAVRLAGSLPVACYEDVEYYRDEVWKAGGEGLILKRLASGYHVGKRSKDWLKVKALQSAKLLIVNFAPGKMGPTSIVMLRDAEGNETSVKWKNLETLRDTAARPAWYKGRMLWIEFQERLPDGSYRHPRWDHLDKENE